MSVLSRKLMSAVTDMTPEGAWDLSYAYYDDPFAWDVSNAVISGNFSVAAQDTAPKGVFFHPDGTKMYVVGDVNNEVFEYSLSQPWVVESATLLGSVLTIDTQPGNIFFKPDGTKMYITANAFNAVHEYSLSTAWDVSTASYVHQFAVSAQETEVYGIFFHPDGTKMYVVGIVSDSVHEYALSTAWDVSTASYVQNFSVAGQEAYPYGVFFHPDGTKMYVIGTTSDSVHEYALSTAWDVSTASYVQNFSVAGQDTIPRGLFFRADGAKMFVVGDSGDSIRAYDLGGLSVAAQEPTPKDLFLHPDGTKMYVVGLSSDAVNEYSLSTAWDISTASYVQNFSVIAQEANTNGIFFKPDGTKMYLIGTSGDDVNEYSLSTAWDVSTASYIQNFYVGAKESVPNGLSFKPDGTKMYVTGFTGKNVNEYSLSTAWDISTASYVQNFSVIAQEENPQSIFFKPDGTKMYVGGYDSYAVNEYSLSTDWDISTASYVQNFSVAAQLPAATGFFIHPDGTKMYVVGDSRDRVFTYTLGVQE